MEAYIGLKPCTNGINPRGTENNLANIGVDRVPIHCPFLNRITRKLDLTGEKRRERGEPGSAAKQRRS